VQCQRVLVVLAFLLWPFVSRVNRRIDIRIVRFCGSM
jgi:hypothetical protein